MATIPCFQGAQAEVELRVRIGILEAELKLCNTQKAASDQVIHRLAEIITTSTIQNNQPRSTTEGIARLRKKLASMSLEKDTLKEQLSQSNGLLSRLLSCLGKDIPSRCTEEVSQQVVVPVKPETQESSTIIDEHSDDEEDFPSDPTENYPSLSTSFSSNSDEFNHIPRFVKIQGSTEKAASKQRLDRETSIVSKQSIG